MKIAVTGFRGIPGMLGGIETHAEELYPRLAQRGKDIVVIRRKNYARDGLSEYRGVKLYDIDSPRKKSLETIIHSLKAVWVAKFRLKANILHIHAVGPGLVVPFARLLGLKVVFTHHGPDYDRDKWGWFAKMMLRTGERWGVRYADEVIVISKVINDLIKEKYGMNDAHTIFNGVQEACKITDEDYLKSLDITPRKYFFAMGRFVPEKNFHQLITAFSAIAEKKGYHLVLAGDADFEDFYARDLKALARENGVILPGFIKDRKLYTLLNNASAFIIPSSHEGLSIALLEAMSYGLPVIASNIPANKQLNLPEKTYFKLNDEKELTELLTTLVGVDYSPVSYSMEQYDWDYITRQTEDVYNKL
jgi:Glycosyltransferase